jgi:WD40 repeat protein/tRNA A-37 threonylcarbamoyl transferase component Bud32
MSDDSARAKEIFLQAVLKATPAERAAYLAQACGEDRALVERLQTLLRAHDTTGSLLDRPAAEHVGLGGEAMDDEAAASGTSEPTVTWFVGDAQAPRGRLGHYRMLELVGQGGYATVFKAFDEKLHRIVAVKVLAPALAATGAARQRFLREARAAAAVRNEHIIAIHAVEEEPSPYLVMEFIDGQTLQQKMDKMGPLPVKEILRIGDQVATGLAAAHRLGLIHRDIKPSNILLENGIERVKLCDFGLARAVDDGSLTQSGQVAGTPLYMSPEQADGRHIDHRTDLFSLGSVLYALCTGHAPFRADSSHVVLRRIADDVPRPLRQCNTDVPEWLERIVERLLAKDPAQRFASAKELADVLAGHLADMQAHGETVQAATKAEPRAGQRRGPWPRRTALAAGVGVAGIVAAALLWHAFGPPAPERGSTTEPGAAPLAAPAVAPHTVANPLDRWKHEEIPPHLLALAGAGDPAQAPAELVGVLGAGRFTVNGERLGGMAMAPTGDVLAVPAGKQVFLFDAKTGRLQRQFTAHEKQLGQVDFSADGKRLLTTGDDTTARMWETATGKLLQVFRGHADTVAHAISDREGKMVITASVDGTARVWDPATGEELRRMQHPSRVYSLALGPKGTLLVTGGHDRVVRVWDVASGELKETLPGHTNEIDWIAFSPDGKYMVSGSQELKIWDGATFQELHTLPAASNWVGFGPGGHTVLAATTPHKGGEAYVVTRWEPATGNRLPDLTLNHRSGYGAFALTPDGRMLFAIRQTPDPEARVRAYDTETGKELLSEQEGHAGQVWSVAFNKDATLLASGGNDRTVRLWHLDGQRNADGQPPVHVLAGHAGLVWSVRFSPDGKLLATGSLDRTIGLWDVARRKRIRTLRGHSATFSRIAFAPDGRTIAAGQEDGAIRFWDTTSGVDTEVRIGHTAAVRCVAYSPNGKLLATGGVDRRVQVYALDDDRTEQSFTLPNVVDNVAFSADGKLLAATTDDSNPSMLNVWDVATWKHTSYPSHPSHAPGLAWSPIAPLALTSGYDRVVRVWDLRQDPPGKRSYGPGPFGSLPAEIAFTADGRYWASANQNGTITFLQAPK